MEHEVDEGSAGIEVCHWVASTAVGTNGEEAGVVVDLGDVAEVGNVLCGDCDALVCADRGGAFRGIPAVVETFGCT